MKNSILTIMLTITLLAPVIVRAQSQGYVVTFKGDTLDCVIDTKLFSNYMQYQTQNTPEFKSIKPTEIKVYYVNESKQLFRSVFEEGHKNPEFMQVIENGKILLCVNYYSNTGFGGSTSTTTEYYIAKNTDTVRRIITSAFINLDSKKERKDYFGSLLKDNKAVYDKYIADDKFSRKEIRNLVHLYNTGEPYKKD